jgi:DNA-binding LytR/AlgR family response regulator
MSLIRTLILDDEPHWQLVLRRMAESHPLLEVIGTYGSPLEALPAIADERPDLLLLDVEFAEMNGFDFAQSLENPPLIVFVTTHDRFALRSYDVEAVDFLVKPVQIERFLRAIDKVRRRLETTGRAVSGSEMPPRENDKTSDFFLIKDQQGYFKVRQADILFVKSLENYIQIMTPTHTYTTLASLNFVENRLGAGFMRVHRSYLVNLDKIDYFNNDLIVVNGQEVPLGGQYLEQFKQEFVHRNLFKR